MRLRLTPQDTTFFDMLSASADNIVLGVQALAKIFDPSADRKAVARIRTLQEQHTRRSAT